MCQTSTFAIKIISDENNHDLLCASVFSFSNEVDLKPTFFIGEVNKTRVTLMIRGDESLRKLRKLKGTTLINLEPECILVEAFCEYIYDNNLRIRLPHNDFFTKRTKSLLGLKENSFVVKYEPVTITNRASKILSVTAFKPEEANKSE